jgi:hypothetical protein
VIGTVPAFLVTDITTGAVVARACPSHLFDGKVFHRTGVDPVQRQRRNQVGTELAGWVDSSHRELDRWTDHDLTRPTIVSPTLNIS